MPVTPALLQGAEVGPMPLGPLQGRDEVLVRMGGGVAPMQCKSAPRRNTTTVFFAWRR